MYDRRLFCCWFNGACVLSLAFALLDSSIPDFAYITDEPEPFSSNRLYKTLIFSIVANCRARSVDFGWSGWILKQSGHPKRNRSNHPCSRPGCDSERDRSTNQRLAVQSQQARLRAKAPCGQYRACSHQTGIAWHPPGGDERSRKYQAKEDLVSKPRVRGCDSVGHDRSIERSWSQPMEQKMQNTARYQGIDLFVEADSKKAKPTSASAILTGIRSTLASVDEAYQAS